MAGPIKKPSGLPLSTPVVASILSVWQCFFHSAIAKALLLKYSEQFNSYTLHRKTYLNSSGEGDVHAAASVGDLLGIPPAACDSSDDGSRRGRSRQ